MHHQQHPFLHRFLKRSNLNLFSSCKNGDLKLTSRCFWMKVNGSVVHFAPEWFPHTTGMLIRKTIVRLCKRNNSALLIAAKRILNMLHMGALRCDVTLSTKTAVSPTPPATAPSSSSAGTAMSSASKVHTLIVNNAALQARSRYPTGKPQV